MLHSYSLNWYVFDKSIQTAKWFSISGWIKMAACHKPCGGFGIFTFVNASWIWENCFAKTRFTKIELIWSRCNYAHSKRFVFNRNCISCALISIKWCIFSDSSDKTKSRAYLLKKKVLPRWDSSRGKTLFWNTSTSAYVTHNVLTFFRKVSA